MTDTLVVEGIQLPTDPPAPKPQTQPSGPQEPPQAPPPAPPGDGGEPQPEDSPAPILETAFIVYMNPQGHWMVAADVHAAAEMQIARPPNVDDFFYGCSMVVKDIQVQETAATATQMTLSNMPTVLKELGEQARQAQATAAINQALGGNPGAGAGAIDLSTLGRGRP